MINKKILLILAIFISFGIALTVFVNQSKDTTHPTIPAIPVYSTIKEHNQSIDYSCTKNRDCVIKNVGNCCGAVPKCVNKNATVDPNFVKQYCSEEGVSSPCGFPSIDSCKCTDHKCEGFLRR